MIYEIGGNAEEVKGSEAFADIPLNRTLFVQQLTAEAPIDPEVVHNLDTVEAVFEHFKPTVNVEFETEEGLTVQEEIGFKYLGEFSPSSLTARSAFLRQNNEQHNLYSKVSKQLKSNKLLLSVLNHAESKAAFLEVLENLIQELNENKQETQ